MATLRKVKSNHWIDSDFRVPPSTGTTKKRGREHNNNERGNVTKKPFMMPPDQELWINKHHPEAADALALQTKKVEEVRSWLLDHGQSGGILLLTGPAGAGKTATISVLAGELDMDIQEWVNPVDQITYGDSRTVFEDVRDYRPNDTVAFTSQSRLFSDWLRGGKYKSLVMDAGGAKCQKLLVVEDLPSFALSKTSEFITILESYSKIQPNHPLVFICSQESSGSKESVQRQIFKPEVTSRLDMHIITVNSCTTTNLVKVLSKIAANESLCGRRQFSVPDKNALEMLAESSGGDIRAAINALQFSCLQASNLSYAQIFQGDNSSVVSSKKSAKSSVPSNRGQHATVGGKDSSLVLFHGLGKVLYAKRSLAAPLEPFPLPSALEHHRRHPLIAQPEAVLEQTAISKDAFACFLHQNYLSFYTNISDISRLTHYFSESDLLLQEWGTAGKMDTTEYGGSLAARAVMFCNQHPAPVSGMRKLIKPDLYGVNRRRDNNWYSVQTALPSSIRPRSEVVTVTVPLLARLCPTSLQPASLLAVTDVGRMSCIRAPTVMQSITTGADLDLFTEEEDEDDRQLVLQCQPADQQPQQQLEEDEELIIEEFED